MELVLHPHLMLRSSALPVERVGDPERRFLERMLKHMRRWNAVGLAAPQVARRQRLIVAQAGGLTLLLANPVVLEARGTGQMEEGCLSVPGALVDVRRAGRVWVRGLDTDNRMVELKLEGLAARVVQHEIDHLNGVLILDHGPDLRREAGKTP